MKIIDFFEHVGVFSIKSCSVGPASAWLVPVVCALGASNVCNLHLLFMMLSPLFTFRHMGCIKQGGCFVMPLYPSWNWLLGSEVYQPRDRVGCRRELSKVFRAHLGPSWILLPQPWAILADAWKSKCAEPPSGNHLGSIMGQGVRCSWSFGHNVRELKFILLDFVASCGSEYNGPILSQAGDG